jgi:predicted DNA-binding transcriptional regulator YafY
MDVQAENAERGVAKMRALVKRPVMNRIEPDLEALTEAEGLAMRPGPRPEINAEIVGALREAIITRHKVKLHYLYRASGKRGYQVVHPYGFLYGNRHYLVAWSESEEARDFRNFALSNIERVEILDRAFTHRRGFSLKDYAERSFGVFQEEPFDVVWKFSPEVADDAKQYLFHPSQKFEEQADGIAHRPISCRRRIGDVLAPVHVGRSIERAGSQEIDRTAERPSAASSCGKCSAFPGEEMTSV